MSEDGWDLHAPFGFAEHLLATIERHHGQFAAHAGAEGRSSALFPTAAAAIAAACELQRCVATKQPEGAPGARVRMAIHTGGAPAQVADRCDQLALLAHGGQILVSEAGGLAAQDGMPAGTSLTPLGNHRLRDLQSTESVWQVVQAGLPAAFPPLRSLDWLPHNLPAALTSFVGRQPEMAELRRLLSLTRMLTVTGPGGSGKTRLALQAGAALLDRFPDGVWLVELADVTDPALVVRSATAVLGLPDEGGIPLLATLTGYLRSRRLLLILDNCEHLPDACAQLVSSLLVNCPHVRILASSREPLGAPGETAWLLPTLAVPDQGQLPPPEQLLGYSAIGLFVERARAVLPAFALTTANAAALVQICHRLDGVPLAIELAAARVRALAVEQIAARLDDRFSLLTRGSRLALPRQRTLRGAIDWSYDLLSDSERVVWRRLAIFTGGFELGAAESVCAGESVPSDAVFELIAQLVDKSLVVSEPKGQRRRYRLLESIHHYGLERLSEAGEAELLRLRHRAWCLSLAEQAEPQLVGPEQSTWLERLEQEHENLRAALQGSLAAGEVAEAYRLASALWRFWYVHGHFWEGREWLGRLLRLEGIPAEPAFRARALNGAGVLAYTQGDFTAAKEHYEASLATWRQLGDTRGIAQVLNNLGVVARVQGDYGSARPLLQEAVALNRLLGNQQWESWNLNNLGNVALDEGDFGATLALNHEALSIQQSNGDSWGEAMSLEGVGDAHAGRGDNAAASAAYAESLAIRRRLGDRRGIAGALAGLGEMLLWQDQPGLARQCLTEALQVRRSLGDRSGLALLLESFAKLAAAEGMMGRALELAGAAEAVRSTLGAPCPPSRVRDLERWLDGARRALGAAGAEAVAAGGRLALVEALALTVWTVPTGAGPARATGTAVAGAAVGSGAPQAAAAVALPAHLSGREKEILGLLAGGLTAREIGQRLHLSHRTVEKHEENLRAKLGVGNRATLVVWAVRQGLTGP
ncbi:MAG: transcriptional regulator, LuxR family [Firmicutes bacterium]|nr:transcriptional regulator, LuxR family [Bacillota bacterium]